MIVVTWFVVLFRFLADGRPSWRSCLAGGALTGVLYSIGKLILSIILRNSNMANIYGASASIVLILLFVFYSSFIIYYGASFIMALSDSSNRPVKPGKKAYRFELQEIN
jgi:membrane protein